MAALDSTIPFFYQGGGTLVIRDGSGNSITATFEQGTFSWSSAGRAYSEAMSRGRRSTTEAPILIEGDDAVTTGQCAFLITSFKGDTNVHPYEALTFSGNADSWTSTSRGNKKSLELELTMNNAEAGGGVQTVTHKYAVFTGVECDMAAVEGKAQVSGSFTNHQNLPSVA